TMRHTEAATRLGLGGAEFALNVISKENERLRKRVSELENREIQVTEFARSVMIREVDTEYMRGKNKQNLALQQAAGDALVKAIPAVIKKITETKALDQTTAVLGKVQGLVKSLSPAQV